MWVTIGNRSFDTADVLTYESVILKYPRRYGISVELTTSDTVEEYEIVFLNEEVRDLSLGDLHRFMYKESKNREWRRNVGTPPPKSFGEKEEEKDGA